MARCSPLSRDCRSARVPVHLRLEELIGVAATVLGAVHREIRMFQQCLGLRAVIGIGDDSNACGEMQILLVDAMRRAQGEEYFLGGDGRIRRVESLRRAG